MQVIGEHTAEPARLRDRELARLRAGAARDVGECSGARAREPCRRETLVEGFDILACAPSGTAGSGPWSRGSPPSPKTSESSPSSRICADVRSPSTVVTMTIEKPSCFCRRTLVRDHLMKSSECTLRLRLDLGHDARTDHGGRRRARGNLLERERPALGARSAPPRPAAGRDRTAARRSRVPSSARSRVVLRAEPLPTERLHEELQAVLLLVLVVAEAMEDAR